MSRLRWWVRALTPPIVPLGLRKVWPKRESSREPQSEAQAVHDEPPEWECVPEGWSRRTTGWDAPGVLEAYDAKWAAFTEALTGSGSLGINHEGPVDEILRGDDLAAHNMLLSFAYVLARASRGRERLSLLDWGGGLGHYCAIARAVLPGVDLEYHCRDLPLLCARGRELFPEARFYEDDSCLARRYDLVVASSSLHYSERWREALAGLAGATGGYLYVTRVPLASCSPSFVVLQRAQRHGYGTEYLGWVLNRGELLSAARDSGLRLLREFLLEARFSAVGAPEDPVHHAGFLFSPGGRPTVPLRSVP